MGGPEIAAKIAPDPNASDEALRARIVASAQTLYPAAQALLLYGSTLTGSHRPDSDVDLVVILPDGDRLQERSVRHNGLRFQLTVLPRPALRHLATASRRIGRAVGLVGLGQGALLWGELPELPELQAEAVRTLDGIGRAGPEHVLQAAHAAIDVVGQAVASEGPRRLALALRAVPMLLEADLALRSGQATFSLSRYRDLAAEAPNLVEEAAVWARAALAGELRPLAQAADRLAAALPPRPDDVILREIPVRALIGRDR